MSCDNCNVVQKLAESESWKRDEKKDWCERKKFILFINFIYDKWQFDCKSVAR